MSRTVKIPDNLHPWECEINGVKYGPYPAGSYQTVPDEVGSVIDAYNSSLPVENPPETLEAEITRIATQIAEAKIAEAMTPFIVTLTMTSETAATADKTTGEIEAEMQRGRAVFVSVTTDTGTSISQVTAVVEGRGVAAGGVSLRSYSTLENSGTPLLVEYFPEFSEGESGTTWYADLYVLTPPEA